MVLEVEVLGWVLDWVEGDVVGSRAVLAQDQSDHINMLVTRV